MIRTGKRTYGYNQGYEKGYNTGYADGYSRGRETGAADFKIPFQGTSIIIPTCNQIDYLKECMESIRLHTPQPYEMIIIDNGSDDGTAEYLKRTGGVRFRINKENLGFARAVNQGLLLAKGTTLLILNNDAVVTANWLFNLLVCVHSDPHIGIVGPVTNYISGEQWIDTGYTNMAGMQGFAREHNRSDAFRWAVTGRLTGFCMLLRREVFQRLGYLDEGFEIGNCEDDDYGLRARLLGLRLVIAKDTFIHHYGSVSMKSLNSRFDQVYEKNLSFYADKWADPHRCLDLERLWNVKDTRLRMIDFYPTCVIVQGAGSGTYWVENGFRHPIDGTCGMEAIRVSQVDLRCWQPGGIISAAEVMQRILVLHHSSPERPIVEGMLVKKQDGAVCQYKGGKLHRIINLRAATFWKLDRYAPLAIDQYERHNDQEGPPIIPPPVIKADNI